MADKRKESNLRRVIVVRNAPDWGASATLWVKEKRLDPALFLPNPLPPSFPSNTADLIHLWNRLFDIDFFTLRQKIKEIAYQAFDKMNPDLLITQREFEANKAYFVENSAIYFTDDDDFAHPDLFNRVVPLIEDSVDCVRWSSISIGKHIENRRVERHFPRLRPWLQYQAELRPNKLPFLVPIFQSRADLRGVKNQLSILPLHTNNYLMKLSSLSSEKLEKFIDHVAASSNLWKSGLKVESLEYEWLSVTIKHPASISAFSNLVKGTNNDAEIRSRMSEYVLSHSAVSFPKVIDWIIPYHIQICDLYKALITK